MQSWAFRFLRCHCARCAAARRRNELALVGKQYSVHVRRRVRLNRDNLHRWKQKVWPPRRCPHYQPAPTSHRLRCSDREYYRRQKPSPSHKPATRFVASAETRILNATENFEPLSHKPTNRNSFFARPSFYPIGVCTVNPSSNRQQLVSSIQSQRNFFRRADGGRVHPQKVDLHEQALYSRTA